jgi:hypothetical protein
MEEEQIRAALNAHWHASAIMELRNGEGVFYVGHDDPRSHHQRP